MPEGPPTNLRSLDDRLRNHCEVTGRNFSRARRHMSALVVAQLLQGTGTVVKGGRNLEVRYGLAATRASSDLDAVRVASREDFIDELEAALEHGWAGFAGRVVVKGPVGAPVPGGYDPERMDVKLDFHSRAFATVELEVAAEEAGGLADVDAVVSADGSHVFAAVGLPRPDPIPVLTLSAQMAQKLHACTAPDTEGWVNERAHDLIDLQLIHADLDDAALPEVRAACERLFRARQSHSWPPVVSARQGWPSRYRRERDGVEADIIDDLDAAIAWANGLVAEIAGA